MSSSDNKIIARPPQTAAESIEDMARVLYAEEVCARKTWEQLAERTRNRYRKLAEQELSEIFCRGGGSHG